MGFRFRKSKKIAPGIRMNVGKTGKPSVSVGNRFLGGTVGSRGPAARVSATGTGASYRRGCGGCLLPVSIVAMLVVALALVVGCSTAYADAPHRVHMPAVFAETQPDSLLLAGVTCPQVEARLSPANPRPGDLFAIRVTAPAARAGRPQLALFRCGRSQCTQQSHA